MTDPVLLILVVIGILAFVLAVSGRFRDAQNLLIVVILVVLLLAVLRWVL